jgi:hypothetical protein
MDVDTWPIEVDRDIKNAKARLTILEAMISALFCRLAELETSRKLQSEPSEASSPVFSSEPEPSLADKFIRNPI